MCNHKWVGYADGVKCELCEKKLTAKQYIDSLKKKKKEKKNEDTN